MFQAQLPTGEGRLRPADLERQLRPRQRPFRVQSQDGRFRYQSARATVHVDGAHGAAGAADRAQLPRHRHRGQEAGADVQQRRRLARSPGQVVQGR